MRLLAFLASALCLFIWLESAPTSGTHVGKMGADKIAVTFLDVGMGDAILIRGPDGKTILVDAGPPMEDFVPLLHKRGVKHLDLLVASHHHTDHIGNMVAVIGAFKPAMYLDSRSSHSTKTYQSVLQAIKAAGADFISPYPGKERQIQLGRMTLRMFPQPPEDEADENNNCIGLRVEFGKFSVLLTGDSAEDQRTWWIRNADKKLYHKPTVFLLPQHGSMEGLDREWLEAVSPQVAVASCGAGNRYGYPHFRTQKLLSRARVDLFRTDQDGSVTFTSDGEDWKVSKDRAEE